jgi:hypothetical protein
MSIRNLVAVAIVWALSLLGVGVWARGDQASPVKPPRTIEWGSNLGPVITGENFGFQRVASQGDRPGKVVGKIMVKIDGQWMEIIPAVGITR